jgi:hypothetical protein
MFQEVFKKGEREKKIKISRREKLEKTANKYCVMRR